MTNKQPYIIITNGVVGSGKTTLIAETIKYYQLDIDYTPIMIDNLVEQHPKYKTQIRNILKEVALKCKNDRKCFLSKISYPETELLDKFSKAYYDVRTNKNCIDGYVETCDEYNDIMIRDAVMNNKNIVFETQGIVIPKWLLDDFVPYNYRVIFAYSLVSLHKLVRRNTERALKSILLFEKNNNNPAPRLPDVRKEILAEKVKVVIDTMQYVLRECMNSTKLKSLCPKRKIDAVIVFDNDTDMYVKIFDSQNIEQYTYARLNNLLKKYLIAS
jgi:hypothetical protein